MCISVTNMPRKIAIAILAGLTAACTVGPKYVKPVVPVPAAYKEMGDGWTAAQPKDDIDRGRWWELYQDARLNTLETQLNISNQNIAAAAANVQAAQALIRASRAQYFPSLTVNPGITNSRISTAFGKSVGTTFNTYQLPLTATWEPDLFGRVKNSVKANTFAAQVSAADLENVRLSAQADLAAYYYQLRAEDALKQLLDATVNSYQEALDLTRNLSKAGLDSDEAVAQAETQLKAAQAQDTSLATLRAQYEHAIAVLAGQPASEFSISPAVFEGRPPAIPAAVPSSLLERRPDIAAAERAVAQANAQIGVAKAAFFPNLILTATGGLENTTIGNWLTWPGRVWSLGPSLAETIFEGGARKATVQQFQAAYDQTAANYRQTVLTSFQQVEDNLAALRVLSQVIEQQEGAIQSSRRSLEEANTRYIAGLDPYLNVIAAETALLANQQSQITFREQQMVASVQLIKALGGPPAK